MGIVLRQFHDVFLAGAEIEVPVGCKNAESTTFHRSDLNLFPRMKTEQLAPNDSSRIKCLKKDFCARVFICSSI